MTRQFRRYLACLGALWLLTGCSLHIDAPQTPTLAPSPSAQPTAVVRLATSTYTPSVTPSPSRTPTVTVSPSHTPSVTLSPSRTPTVTVSPSRTPSVTPSPSRTPTVTVSPSHTPSVTLSPTQTFTPFPPPTLTPTTPVAAVPDNPTAPPASVPPGPTDTPALPATPPPTLTPPPGEGTFYDPYASPASQGALPVAPAGESGPIGPALPEINQIVVSYAGQIAPLVALPAGAGAAAPLAQGDVFAVSRSGQVAAVAPDHQLYVDGAPLLISPASQYGLPPVLQISDLAWSPDGTHLALRVDASDPNHVSAIDSGVWIYEPASNRSWQVFRNTYAGQVEQLHQQRQARGVTWAPHGLALAIAVETPLGLATVPVPLEHDANDWVEALPYASATWTADSRALIVSGNTWDGRNVVGRVELDALQTYTEYTSQPLSGIQVHSAVLLANGRLALVGSAAPGSLALYVMPAAPGAQPVQVTRTLSGQVLRAEWNASRSAVLITLRDATGATSVWLLRPDGAAQPIALGEGPVNAARWR